MMSQNPFTLFLDLVAFDNALREYEEKIQQYEIQKKALIAQKEEFANLVVQLKKQEHDVRKKVDMHELHMKDLDQKERSKKNLLDDINTPKEYTIVKREIEALHREQHDHENTLMGAWSTLESIHKSSEAKEEEFTKFAATVDTHLLDIAQKEQEIQEIYNQKMSEREQKLTGIPEEWLEKYRAMQSRVVDPVVPVQQGSCSACFFDITEQRLVALRRHALLQCEGCYRFLYIPDRAGNSELLERKDS